MPDKRVPGQVGGVHVQAGGPYVVRDTPLVRRRQVHSEHGGPMTRQTVAELETREVYTPATGRQQTGAAVLDLLHRAWQPAVAGESFTYR